MSTYWTWLLPLVDEHSETLPNRDAIRAGYTQLRECLGEEPFEFQLRQVLSDFIVNLVPDSLTEWSDLGHLLATVRKDYGIGVLMRLRARLLSEVEDTVRGVLAELQVFERLRAREVPVRLVRAEGVTRTADLVVDATDIEVSFLSIGSTWRLAQELDARIRRGTAPLAQEHGLFVRVECQGFAGELLPQVPEAVERFHDRMNSERPWVKELTTGLTFHVEDSEAPRVEVSGATIKSGDLFSNEGLLVRLPTKLIDEASQVRAGGIVLIRTSELSSDLSRSKVVAAEFILELVRRIEDVGSRTTNVSVFALLDEMGATSPAEIPQVPAPATLSQSIKGLTRQLLLWVPNQHATVRASPETSSWFTLPF